MPQSTIFSGERVRAKCKVTTKVLNETFVVTHAKL